MDCSEKNIEFKNLSPILWDKSCGAHQLNLTEGGLPMNAIEVTNLRKSYGQVEVLKGSNLQVKRGSLPIQHF
jgi:hypothetical protein